MKEKEVVLFDGNNLAIRVVNNRDVKEVNSKKVVTGVDWDYWEYLMFTNLYGCLFKNNTKTIVVAIDDKRSWRYDIWSRYKEDRRKKKKNDKTEFPWNEFFERYEKWCDEITKYLPIKIIKVNKAEGDDIIGTIVRNIFDKCVVISVDKDFLQLSSDRCKIYSPFKQCHVSHPDTEAFIIEQCLIGQSKDTITNIKTPWMHPEGKRRPGFGPKALEKVLVYGWKQWLIDNDLYHRYDFNRSLMDFERIPQWLQDNIMNEYNSIKYPDPDMIYQYIKEKGWPEYLEQFTSLEDKFLQLY